MTNNTIILAALAGLCLGLAGCSNPNTQSSPSQVASTIAVHGTYIASGNGSNLILVFSNEGCDIVKDGTYDPLTRNTTGNILWTHASYTLVGTTLRVSGGTATPYEQARMAAHGNVDSGNVSLFQVTNSGQSLTMTLPNGTPLMFIKQ